MKLIICELELGASLYDVLNYLISQGFNMKFVFSETEIIETPYILLIKQLSIRLIFNGDNQLLQFIELDKFDNLNLFYKDRKVGSLSLKNIYNNSFGPTYPGKICDGHYILSYPGISFKFLIPPQLGDVDKKNMLMKLLEQDLINLLTIVVHHEQNYQDVYKNQIAYKEDAYSLMDSSSSINKMNHKTEGVDIARLDVNMPLGKVMIRFRHHPDVNVRRFEIILTKTLQQDVLSIIGPPDEVFIKNDSRLNIHNDTKKSKNNTNGNDSPQGSSTDGGSGDVDEVFHNYFRYGFDLLYDISSNQGAKVKKIILHNNLPNSLFFQKYKKCIWRMMGYKQRKKIEGEAGKDREEIITSKPQHTDWDWCNSVTGLSTSEMYFNEIPKAFKVNGQNSPIILNRNDLYNNSLDNSIEFVTIDETDSVNSKTSGNKSWGQSLIYAYKRCIWEVLSVNNAVNSVTLY